MANEKQLSILKQGVDAWNKFRWENLDVKIDLREADFGDADLGGADFGGADLSLADFHYANLRGANFGKAELYKTDFGDAILLGANLHEAKFNKTILTGTIFRETNLSGIDLRNISLRESDLRGANLTGANLRGADLTDADLTDADFTKANLTEADLTGAILVKTNIHKAKISGSLVYGVNVWDLKGEFEEQNDLVITPEDAPIITVDDIKVAQFIYLILDNKRIRDVINTLTSKSVLILGRFSIAERKAVLDALRNKLREYDLLPIVFDFDRPTDKDFTETIKTLAGLSYFVIADVTNPKSSPLELQATVPDYQIPFVPIIQKGEKPFTMMLDLQNKYGDWVLDTLEYASLEELIEVLKPAIIDPAIEKHNELRLTKAQKPKIRSAKDFLKHNQEYY